MIMKNKITPSKTISSQYAQLACLVFSINDSNLKVCYGLEANFLSFSAINPIFVVDTLLLT